MRSIFFVCSLANIIFRSPLYSDVYTADTNQAGINGLTLLPLASLAPGLTYYVAEPVGTDANNDRRFVMRPRTISSTNLLADIQIAQMFIRRGVAYTTNGGFTAGGEAVSEGYSGPVYLSKEEAENDQSEKVAGHYLTNEDIQNNPELAEKGYKAGSYFAIPLGSPGSSNVQDQRDGSDITVTKTTNEAGVQNDSEDGLVADNTTNQIQAEQVAHTIFQTTEQPEPFGTRQGEAVKEESPTTPKTTNESGVQNSEGGEYDNVPQGNTGAEWREDEAREGSGRVGKGK